MYLTNTECVRKIQGVLEDSSHSWVESKSALRAVLVRLRHAEPTHRQQVKEGCALKRGIHSLVINVLTIMSFTDNKILNHEN